MIMFKYIFLLLFMAQFLTINLCYSQTSNCDSIKSEIINKVKVDIEQQLDQRLKNYEALFSGISLYFGITSLFLAIYLSFQGVGFYHNHLHNRKQNKAIDEKYNEIVSIRTKIDDKLDAERNYRIAEEFRMSGKFSDAIKYYKEALRRYPFDQEYFYNYGKVLIESNLYHEAIDLFNEAISVFEDINTFHESIAECFEKINKQDLALKKWQFLLNKNEDKPLYHKKIGLLYYQIADYEKALDHFEIFNKINPDVVVFQYTINSYICLYDKYKKEHNVDRSQEYVWKLIHILKELFDMNKKFFNIVYKENVIDSMNYPMLNKEEIFKKEMEFYKSIENE